MTQLTPLFFVHIMKTAGTNLKWRFHQTFRTEEVYPNHVDDEALVQANTLIDYLVNIPAARKQRTRAFAGHFPYVAVEMLGIPCHTITFVREPVDRVVSHLRQVRRNKTGWQRFSPDLEDVDDPTFQQLYDDPFLRPRFFIDHQVRIFSMGLEDDPKTYVDLFDVNERRLEIAKQNLAKIDDIGLTSEYAAFEAHLGEQHGLATKEMPRLQAAPDDDLQVPDDLRERIEAENSLDIAFYEHALGLVEERRSAG